MSASKYDAEDVEGTAETEEGTAGTEEEYTDHMVMGHTFSAIDATKRGFYSKLRPPSIDDQVVCYRRDLWLKHGVVVNVDKRKGDGTDGLQQGHDGVMVSVEEGDGTTFQCWAVFLAPQTRTERSYSWIASNDEFLASNYCSLITRASLNKDSQVVTKEQARKSCEEWINHFVDDDGEHMDVPSDLQAELLHVFDLYDDPSLHLYTRQQPLVHGARFIDHSQSKEHDYSLYYLALNNTLNHDNEENLEFALPLIMRMNYLLLYTEDTQKRLLHPGGTLYKGDAKAPQESTFKKLERALASGEVIRFCQFQSTSADAKVANKFRTSVGPADDAGDRKHSGFLWTVDVPPGFWGARSLEHISKVSSEAETLFPPYSMFRVKNLSQERCQLEAVDRSEDHEYQNFQETVQSRHSSADPTKVKLVLSDPTEISAV